MIILALMLSLLIPYISSVVLILTMTCDAVTSTCCLALPLF